MTVSFMEALQRGDINAASAELGAQVPTWLADDMQDFMEYRLSQVERGPLGARVARALDGVR